MRVLITEVDVGLEPFVPYVRVYDCEDLLTYIRDEVHDEEERNYLTIEKEVVDGVEMVLVYPKREDEEFYQTTYIKLD